METLVEALTDSCLLYQEIFLCSDICWNTDKPADKGFLLF